MSYDEIFDRVSKLVDEVVVKSAQKSVKRAQDPSDEKYNTWTEIDPKETSFTKALDQIVSRGPKTPPTKSTTPGQKSILKRPPLRRLSTRYFLMPSLPARQQQRKLAKVQIRKSKKPIPPRMFPRSAKTAAITTLM